MIADVIEILKKYNVPFSEKKGEIYIDTDFAAPLYNEKTGLKEDVKKSFKGVNHTGYYNPDSKESIWCIKNKQ